MPTKAARRPFSNVANMCRQKTRNRRRPKLISVYPVSLYTQLFLERRVKGTGAYTHKRSSPPSIRKAHNDAPQAATTVPEILSASPRGSQTLSELQYEVNTTLGVGGMIPAVTFRATTSAQQTRLCSRKSSAEIRPYHYREGAISCRSFEKPSYMSSAEPSPSRSRAVGAHRAAKSPPPPISPTPRRADGRARRPKKPGETPVSPVYPRPVSWDEAR